MVRQSTTSGLCWLYDIIFSAKRLQFISFQWLSACLEIVISFYYHFLACKTENNLTVTEIEWENLCVPFPNRHKIMTDLDYGWSMFSHLCWRSNRSVLSLIVLSFLVLTFHDKISDLKWTRTNLLPIFAKTLLKTLDTKLCWLFSKHQLTYGQKVIT